MYAFVMIQLLYVSRLLEGRNDDACGQRLCAIGFDRVECSGQGCVLFERERCGVDDDVIFWDGVQTKLKLYLVRFDP